MRIDVYLTEKGYCKSRTKAAEAIAQGRVWADGVQITKASFPVTEEVSITVRPAETQYVSRAGYKLEAALTAFPVSVEGKTAVDIGASTGGFTDCLLQNGASFVYAVDVGTGQLDETLLSDARVCCMEHTNARFLTQADFPRRIDLAVMDVSFISQRLLYPAIASLLPSGGSLISLIKPQFEAGKARVGKGGIVKDPTGKIFSQIKTELQLCARQSGLELRAHIPSPIPGGDGNHEYLAHFVRIDTETETKNRG